MLEKRIRFQNNWNKLELSSELNSVIQNTHRKTILPRNWKLSLQMHIEWLFSQRSCHTFSVFSFFPPPPADCCIQRDNTLHQSFQDSIYCPGKMTSTYQPVGLPEYTTDWNVLPLQARAIGSACYLYPWRKVGVGWSTCLSVVHL